MKTTIDKVRKQSRLFRQHISDRPTIPPTKIRLLRAKLSIEECLEKVKGLGFDVVIHKHGTIEFFDIFQPDLIQIADGVFDCIWVDIGTALACGVAESIIFERLFHSNMSKLWTYKECLNKGFDALKLISIGDSLTNSENWKCELVCRGEKKYLVTNEDGKFIKSPSYIPLHLKDLITTNIEQKENKCP